MPKSVEQRLDDIESNVTTIQTNHNRLQKQVVDLSTQMTTLSKSIKDLPATLTSGVSDLIDKKLGKLQENLDHGQSSYLSDIDRAMDSRLKYETKFSLIRMATDFANRANNGPIAGRA